MTTELMTLPAALNSVAGDIAEIDLERGRDAVHHKFEAVGFFLTDVIGSSRDPYATANKMSRDIWSTRESAVVRLQAGIRKGVIEIFVRNPHSGTIIQIAPEDLFRSAYFEDTMRGGVVRATAGEDIEKYRGFGVLIKAASFKKWRAAEKLRRPAADEAACGSWLLDAMIANPFKKPKAKAKWRPEAKQRFGVTGRPFRRAWEFACKESGSNWGRGGRIENSSS